MRILSIVFAALVFLGACNPNYCADHENNDCRAPLLDEVPDCATSADCAGRDGALACNDAKGVCVQCTAEETSACGGKAPECNADNQCQACSSHAACASDACLPDGSCATEDQVAYVSPSGTSNMTCSKNMPCNTVAAAVAARRPFVRVRDELAESVVLRDAIVTLLGDSTSTISSPLADRPALEIRGSGQIEIRGLTIIGPTGSLSRAAQESAIWLNNSTAQVTIVGATLKGSSGNGIYGSASLLRLQGSKILNNKSGGVDLRDTIFEITNTVISENGYNSSPDEGSALGGVLIAGANSINNRFEFNTVTGNKSGVNTYAGVNCSSGTKNVSFVSNTIASNLSTNAMNEPLPQVNGLICTAR